MAIFLVPSSGAGFLPLIGGTLTGDISLDASELRFLGSNPSNYTALAGPAGVTGQVVWTLPLADGSVGQLLSTDGNGNLGWTNGVGALVTDGGNFDNGTSTISTSQTLDGGQF